MFLSGLDLQLSFLILFLSNFGFKIKHHDKEFSNVPAFFPILLNSWCNIVLLSFLTVWLNKPVKSHFN